MANFENTKFNFRRRTIIAGVAAASAQLAVPLSTSANNRSPSSTRTQALDLDHFVEDCVAANQGTDAQAAVKEVLAKAVSAPNAVISALGEPHKAGIRVLLRSSTLTIFSASWTPQMNLMPHDHLMWANIGIYTGREDNIFWRRTSGGIEAYGAEALFVKGTASLPADVVHSVTNPLLRFTGGIHIYGGDFFATTRSQWDPETLAEEPSDGAVIRGIFQRENERLGLPSDV